MMPMFRTARLMGWTVEGTCAAPIGLGIGTLTGMEEVSFGPVAPVYDHLMRQVPYEMWAGYLKLLFAHVNASPHTLLDVCCGTGTVAEILSREGYKVAGFDISPPMIDRARRKARAQGLGIEYHVADAAEVDLGGRYDAAYSFFDSLNYIVEPERLALALSRVRKHLEPGGVFVFDLNTAYAFEKKLFDQHHLDRRSELRYQWKGSYDPSSLLIRVDMTFWHNGREFREVHLQRAHPIEEVAQMLQDASFAEVQTFHSYTLDRPRKTSDRIHFLARAG